MTQIIILLLGAIAAIASIEQTLEGAAAMADNWGNPWPYFFVLALIGVDAACLTWYLSPERGK